MYAPVLCGKLHVYVDLHFWLALLHFLWFFLGPGVLQCVFSPSPVEWSGEGVCHLSVPPFARCMHLSCVESSMYVLTFTFGLRCFIFHVFFVGPGVLPCVFYNFAWVLPSFLHSLPRLNGLERGVCHLSVPPFARCMHLSCVESSMYVFDLHFGLALLHFSWFFLGPGVLPCVFYTFACFWLHFCIAFPDWMVWTGVCAIFVWHPHLQEVRTCLVWKAPCMCWPSLLACAASFFMVFSRVLESSNVVFYNFAWFCLHFCIVFPDWMVSMQKWRQNHAKL